MMLIPDSAAIAPDLPELLTAGKEGPYIKSFYDRLVSDSCPCHPRKTIQILSEDSPDKQTRLSLPQGPAGLH